MSSTIMLLLLLLLFSFWFNWSWWDLVSYHIELEIKVCDSQKLMLGTRLLESIKLIWKPLSIQSLPSLYCLLYYKLFEINLTHTFLHCYLLLLHILLLIERIIRLCRTMWVVLKSSLKQWFLLAFLMKGYERGLYVGLINII